MLFIQHLSGLIKGLRANKDDEDGFIQATLQEIKQEIKSADIDIKSVAVLKLSYLEMLGYDISWSAFPIIETASSSKLHLKSIGYLAASLSFTPQTDVMMLMPNLLKKDLASEPSAALSCFSTIATPELSIDLSGELSRLSTHTRPSIRQKAIAAILIAIKQTNDIDLADFKKRLRERLQDEDVSVLSATVSAITELASSFPTQCLGFAPPLYALLTSSNNNWMVIKILKLFAALLPHEQRLQKKLYAPISDLIESTTAVSVLYECVLTCIVGGMLHKNNMAANCLEKLTTFLTDDDRNLKYVALLAIAQMIPSHAHLLHAHEYDLLSTLDDPDLSIRLQGLEVVSTIVTAANVEPVMNKLFEQLVPPKADAAASLRATPTTFTPSYVRRLAQTILDICKRDHYTNIPSFGWLINVVVQLSKVVPGTDDEDELAKALQSTLIELAVMYPQTREYSVSVSLSLLGEYVESTTNNNSSIAREMLPAAIYILGEYAMFLDTPHAALSHLTHLTYTHYDTLSPFTVGVALNSLAKVYGIHAMLLANSWEEDTAQVKVQDMAQLARAVIDGIVACALVNDVDVKERTRLLTNLLHMVWGELGRCEGATTEAPHSLYLLSSIYFDKPGAVPLEDDVDLDTPLLVDLENEVYTDDEGEREEMRSSTVEERGVDTAEENRRRRHRKAALRAERAANPYYIKSKSDRQESESENEDDVDSIPIVKFEPDEQYVENDSQNGFQYQDQDVRDSTPHTALFYPKSSSRSQSLKSASTPPLHTSSSQSSLSTPHSQEPQALSTGTVNKVVKKKKAKS